MPRIMACTSIRKMWRVLCREGITIGREQTARLVRLAKVTGNGKGRFLVTTRRPKGGSDYRLDLVGCEFRDTRPNRLWVVDVTYVRTRKRVRVHGFCH